MKLIKQAVYNEDKTECLEIGYYEDDNNEIQISQFPNTVQKVPSELPEEITSLKFAFSGNQNAQIKGIENWDTSNVKDMSWMFIYTDNFNQDISNWNTSNVKTMESMFGNSHSFNQDISKWDVSKVEDMSWMFYKAENFNQDISNWDVSKVKDKLIPFTNDKTIDEYFKKLEEAPEETWTKEEVEEQKDKEVDYFKEMVSQADKEIDEMFYDPDKLQNFFAFATLIQNNYSARNLKLIQNQFPGATVVKSFTEWRDKETPVKKGEKGLKIVRPVIDEYVVVENNGVKEKIYKKNWTKEIWEKIRNSELEIHKSLSHFKPANVFDISQTTTPKEKYPLNYFASFMAEDTQNLDYNQKLYNELKSFTQDKNIELKENCSLGQVKGLSSFKHNPKIIWLNEHNSTKQNIKTLLHEYAHIKFNHSYEDTSRAECEYQAEMAAWAIAKTLNVDTKEYSYDYIKSWIQNSNITDKSKWMDKTIKTVKDIHKELNQHFENRLTNISDLKTSFNKEAEIASQNLEPLKEENVTKNIMIFKK
ncbi:BspA family leucine-rich repeat surface protein [Mycoplasma feriruminatoris]|uniref:Uncharacterized protein n=1 Tax=Mycoplasma feriruminatoris TaxID=1179777 RepID=A0AAX3TFY4_9MOLU|nr:BspA family leucine-rich repeat surface protein [Mycoplasma feriruminatoris]WFQ93046.1 hypothetical protein MFERI14822_00839 [Mycoplasma feriruminatoris]